MIKVYISGPMTGLPEFNYPAFHECARKYRHFGFEVVNPAELAAEIGEGKKWIDYMRLDLKALVDCDGIVMLPGWEKSKGAKLELLLAVELGLKIHMEGG